MLKLARKFLKDRSPSWLNVEVNRVFRKNFSQALNSNQLHSSGLSAEGNPKPSNPAISNRQVPSFKEGKIQNPQSKINNRIDPPLPGGDFCLEGKPHWRRTKQVFEVLDSAPPKATYTELIDYVREATGKGCSKKLISKWKKQRRSNSEETSIALLPRREEKVIATAPITSTVETPKVSEQSDNPSEHSALSTLKAVQPSSWWSYAAATVLVAGGLVGCDWALSSSNSYSAARTSHGGEFDSPPVSSSSETVEQTVTPPTPEVFPVPRRSSRSLEPRNIKIALTLSNPQDLLVKPGDEVVEGQALSDRATERDRLIAKQQQLQLSLKKLDVPLSAPVPPKPIPEIKELPPISYAEEEANIKLKAQALEDAKAATAKGQEKIKQLEPLLSTTSDDSAREKLTLIIEHEQAKLENLTATEAEAQTQLEIAQAQLATAKERRAYAEHQHQLEETRRAMAIEQQRLEVQRQEAERERQLQVMEYNKSQIRAQIQEVDNAIAQLGQVKSPYKGVVKKIKWVGQSDNVLNAELTLAVTSDGSAVASSRAEAAAGNDQ